jgi:hypothetical protein
MRRQPNPAAATGEASEDEEEVKPQMDTDERGWDNLHQCESVFISGFS